ncbi:hypothetical protein [Endozoicomonas sp. 8E]|uniref:hypothetical protein n=1 Tax=Endozoicomonas sp. 8E TaxID=3035692 RepID=UPI002938DDC8|nr:hypothetical protein [Endozoicomonas sp. 8E]WOG30097.1 hypothetical protein P6910_10710 [Endozoicomonas sp. 8E]
MMKTSGKVRALLPCLLFLCSAAHSGISKEGQLKLLSHYSNASLVEDSLKLATSSSGLAISTVINYGFWYGICKSPEVVSALAGRFDLSGTEQNELREVKSSFCNQLAAVITSTEVALAGHLSLWPLELPWWQPLRFVGTAYSVYDVYTNFDPDLIPITTAAYFTGEVVARTVAGATAVTGLRHQNKSAIQPLDYTCTEYNMMSLIAGMMVGTIVYEKMIAREFSSVKASFGYVISAALTDGISAISSLSRHRSDCIFRVGTVTAAEVLAGTGAIAGAWATAIVGAGTVALSSPSELSGIIAAFTLFLTAPPIGLWGVAGMNTGAIVGAGVMVLLKQQCLRLDSNHLLNNVALSLAPALALALINSISNYAVYGYSLEDSLSETTRKQWQKFHAPLDYLYTLFQ